MSFLALHNSRNILTAGSGVSKPAGDVRQAVCESLTLRKGFGLIGCVSPSPITATILGNAWERRMPRLEKRHGGVSRGFSTRSFVPLRFALGILTPPIHCGSDRVVGGRQQ